MQGIKSDSGDSDASSSASGESDAVPDQPSETLTTLCRVVTDVANKMGLHKRVSHQAETKEDGSYVTQIDTETQRLLVEALCAQWPDTQMLGEEMHFEEQSRVLREADTAYGDGADGCTGVWCIDPVDGTTNFLFGFPFFAISVALVDRNGPRLGVVYDPNHDECFAAERGRGAWLNGTRLRTSSNMELRECMACVDYKRLVSRLSERLVRSAPFRSQRHLGSSALEWCWLASGRIQVYIHGGQKLWDYSAGVLILREAGGAACTLEGAEIRCNTLTKRSVLAASSETVLKNLHSWIEQNIRYG